MDEKLTNYPKVQNIQLETQLEVQLKVQLELELESKLDVPYSCTHARKHGTDRQSRECEHS